jgi:hypothetical protein
MIRMLVRGLMVCVAGAASTMASEPTSRVVLDEVVSEGYSYSTAAFAMNKETKHAWIEAAVHNGGTGDDYSLETFRLKLPGLSYDTQMQEVVYHHQGAAVVCARVTTSKSLLTTRTRIRSTGHCELLARLERRKDDTGFEYETTKHLVVELSVIQP